MSVPSGVADGLAPERTGLAWMRTALAIALLGLLALRFSAGDAVAAVLALLAVALASLVMARPSIRSMGRAQPGPAVLIAVAVLATGVSGVVLLV